MKCLQCGEENPDLIAGQVSPEQIKLVDQYIAARAEIVELKRTLQSERAARDKADEETMRRIDELVEQTKRVPREEKFDIELLAARARMQAQDRQLRLQQETNLAHHMRLEAVDALCAEWTGTDVRDGAVFECGERLSKVLLEGDSPKLPYPDAVHAAFHWRDRERPDGLLEALCGDGFGFLYATDTKLGLTFDCAGVLACADIPFEQLRETLAQKGLQVVTEDNYTKLTELIATSEDRRVLDAVERLSVGTLKKLGSSRAYDHGAGNDPLDAFVSFELDRRIACADLDLPHYRDDATIIETPHEQLFEELEQAIERGNAAAALTPTQREARFEAYLRAHGYLKEGEQLRSRVREEPEHESEKSQP